MFDARWWANRAQGSGGLVNDELEGNEFGTLIQIHIRLESEVVVGYLLAESGVYKLIWRGGQSRMM